MMRNFAKKVMEYDNLEESGSKSKLGYILWKVTKIKKGSRSKKRKKYLLLSDDLRMSSGVGTMSREFVMGTIDEYDWVQVGGAIPSRRW